VGRAPTELEGIALGAWLPAASAATLAAQLAQPTAAHAPLTSAIAGGDGPKRRIRLQILPAAVTDDGLALLVATPVASDASSLRAIMENTSIGIAFTRDGVIERSNEAHAFTLLFSEPLAELRRACLPDAESYERLMQDAADLLARGKTYQADWAGTRADGSPVWCRVYGKSLDPAHAGRDTMWIVEDVTDERRSEAILRKTLHDSEAFMQNANVAILMTRDGHVLRYNPRFSDMFRVEGDNAVGAPARALHRSEDEYAAFERVADPLLSAGKPFQQELWMRRQDGSDFWANLFGYLINPENPAEGAFWICEDRSAYKEVEAALAQRTEELARSNSDLEQFAYVASHDLQEPLRMVSSYVQLLERRYRDKLDADAKEFMDFAVDGAKRMQALINDLLAYSRVGTKGRPFAPVDCETVLATVLTNLQLVIGESGARINHDPLPTVMGDATQLAQLFQNLLGNALKFRGDKPPQIHVGVESVDGFWQFTFRDNGIGIAPEHFERIFIIFQRLHGHTSYPGTGIGLAVCKKVVERHGGHMWLESEPGRGSAFHFTIPHDKEHMPEA
jgi:PAS domain S-box-containing protein